MAEGVKEGEHVERGSLTNLADIQRELVVLREREVMTCSLCVVVMMVCVMMAVESTPCF